MSDVTFAITSCCRADLLERTIRSFLAVNTYPIADFVMIDDGTDLEQQAQIRKAYGGMFRLIITEGHYGHPACVDRLYREISTKYIFHCQDDWEFEGDGSFITQSLDILDSKPNVGVVWIRRNDVEHPFDPEIECTATGTSFQRPMKGWLYGSSNYHDDGWFGFTFNPGLRRLDDYLKMMPYSKYGGEKRCGWEFRDMGLEAVVLMDNHVRHIGWGRGLIK